MYASDDRPGLVATLPDESRRSTTESHDIEIQLSNGGSVEIATLVAHCTARCCHRNVNVTFVKDHAGTILVVVEQ